MAPKFGGNMSLFEKIFGTYSSKQIKKIEPIVNEIEALADKFSAMSDIELQAVTPAFRSRLDAGETLDDILPEAFAAVREAATRVLGKRPFRVQIMGGIILHQGRIAEMKTGEGKTLVATMPAYLNALTGKGVHIVTVNDYLARRDSEEMGKVYGFLGLTTGLIQSAYNQSAEQKKAAYACDITYGTNNEMGFDYLRDNMVIYKEKTVQRGYNFAIVDEVDSILIDEARTPLIISGPGSASDEMYGRADAFVRSLRALKIKEKDTKSDYEDVSEDYIVDEKAKRATLTHNGIAKAERFFGVENYADIENTDLTHYVNQALHAHGCMKLDVDYVVMDGKVLIVDSFTGRIMPGRRFSDGLHQAIEAKERVKIENENQTQATITFQNYFRLYGKLSGMTGTALTEEEEFRSIYSLDVVEIPTNRPMIRLDRNDVVYKNEKGKYEAIIEQIRACHEKGQPVLVGTVSVDKSELLSKLLSRVGIKHNVLNAKYHEKEAEIIAQAGKYGAVTISTNMAGRGTDIMLGGNAEFLAKNELRKNGYNEEEILLATGSSEDIIEHVRAARELFREKLEYFKAQIAPEAEEVRKAGGLFILGTERHESRRIDNQLRGRAGRQGDPGESRFYLSLEDDLLRLFGSERIQGLVERLGLPDDQPIDAKILSGTIENAQSQLEMNNFNRRKNVLDYDDVMNQHRNVIYGERRRVLDGEDISETIEKMIHGTITDAVSESIDMESGKLSIDDLRKNIFWLVSKEDFAAEKEYDAEEVTKALTERADAVYQHQKEAFGENIRELERVALLRSVDVHWMEHLDAMDDLRGGVGLAAYAQRNPLNEYRIAAGEMFDAMISNIRVDTVRMILFSRPVEQIKRTQVAKQRSENAAAVGSEQTKKRPVVKAEKQKVGRNDPCPCGSGKKYKKCCGASDTQAD